MISVTAINEHKAKYAGIPQSQRSKDHPFEFPEESAVGESADISVTDT